MNKHIQNIRLANSQNQDKVDSINAFQGAVTENGFKVYSKLTKPNVYATLQVFTDAEMTSLVFSSIPTISDEFNVVRFQVSGLTPFTKYYWSIIYKGRKTTITGEIKTLPSGNASFKIVAGSCAVGPQIAGPDFRYSNHEIFRHIKEDRADEIALMWHTGDIHYQDIKSENAIDYSNAFDGVLRQNKQQELYLKVPLMYMWDDHDFTGNDSNGAKNPEWTEPALESYRKRIPSYDLPFSGALEPVCHQVKIGRVLLINLDCRSQKEKHLGTILGTIQKQWLKDTMIASDAEAFIINVGVPWISPSGGDMWGSVAIERTELMDFWADNGFSSKIILLAGDAHCVAIDDGTNNQDKNGTGIPVFQFAAYDSPPTVKGGPYSEGYSDNLYQYGMIDIEDKGTSIDITGTGYRVVGGKAKVLTQTYKKTIII